MRRAGIVEERCYAIRRHSVDASRIAGPDEQRPVRMRGKRPDVSLFGIEPIPGGSVRVDRYDLAVG